MIPPSRRILLSAALLLAACGDPSAPRATTSVVSIEPQGGATGVDPNAPIVLVFSHAMQAGMERYAALHEGSATGPLVPGSWAWSADGTTLTFTPAEPLKAQTQYALYLGGAMRATDGGAVDWGACARQHGGQWAGAGAGGGMMGGGMMGGGMVFTFTTAFALISESLHESRPNLP